MFGQTISQLFRHSVSHAGTVHCQSISQSISQSVSQSISQSVSQSCRQSVVHLLTIFFYFVVKLIILMSYWGHWIGVTDAEKFCIILVFDVKRENIFLIFPQLTTTTHLTVRQQLPYWILFMLTVMRKGFDKTNNTKNIEKIQHYRLYCNYSFVFLFNLWWPKAQIFVCWVKRELWIIRCQLCDGHDTYTVSRYTIFPIPIPVSLCWSPVFWIK